MAEGVVPVVRMVVSTFVCGDMLSVGMHTLAARGASIEKPGAMQSQSFTTSLYAASNIISGVPNRRGSGSTGRHSMWRKRRTPHRVVFQVGSGDQGLTDKDA